MAYNDKLKGPRSLFILINVFKVDLRAILNKIAHNNDCSEIG
jgi:hypothetical protein